LRKPTCVSSGAGTITAETSIDFSQGNLVRTDQPLDLALEGKGFFVVETPDGPVYTRAGTFHVNHLGRLVDAAGRGVAGEGGPITVPNTVGFTETSVSPEGRVYAAGADIGKLRMVTFEDESALSSVGEGNYQAPTSAAPQPATKATVHQGFREASNVNVVEALVGLITVTRLYEANIKAIASQDEQMKTILQAALS